MFKLYNITTRTLIHFIHEGVNENPMIMIPVDTKGRVIGHAAQGLIKQSDVPEKLIKSRNNTIGSFSYEWDPVTKITWVVVVVMSEYVDNRVLRTGRVPLKSIVFTYANAMTKILTSYRQTGLKKDPIFYIPHFDGVGMDKSFPRVYEQLLLLGEHLPVRVQCYYTHVAYRGNFGYDVELVEYKPYHYKSDLPPELDEHLNPEVIPKPVSPHSIALRYPYAKS